jgi:N-formylglutamate deformylase
MTPEALTLPDTDWHVERLYDFARRSGCGLIVATHSRYVVDLNRDPTGKPLYPGADNTELVPTRTFAGEPIWREGAAPDEAEIEARRVKYWAPYLDAVASEVAFMKQKFGLAVVWDGHSIASRVPRFFEGKLPDLNLGTVGGISCEEFLAIRVFQALKSAEGFTAVHNGRFKGGYITRRFGRPADSVHALQLELAQSTYMDEGPPFAWNARAAEKLRPVLDAALAAVLGWARGRIKKS